MEFVFIFLTSADVPALASYLLGFVPSRFVEWFLVFRLIAGKRNLKLDAWAGGWIVCGVLATLAVDLSAWAVMGFPDVESLRFFC